MSARKKIGLAAALCVLAVLIVQPVALGADKSAAPAIRVGTKDFTESLIVGELYALALEDAGYKVSRVFNIAGSIVHASIVNGQIDL